MSRTSYEIAVKAVAWFLILKQIRDHATDEEDAQLTESIRQYGILQPLGARYDGKLVWGHRRLKAAIAAGLKEVPTVILHKEMTEGQYLTLQMLENVQRSDLSPYDLWQGCVRLLAANPGWQHQDLGKALSLSPSTVTRILSASRVIPAWLEEFRKGTVGSSDLYAASKLPEADQAGLLLLRLNGASRDQIEAAGKRARRAVMAAPAAKISKGRFQVPGKSATVVVTGDDLSLTEIVEILQELVKEAAKASQKGLDAKTFERVCRDLAKKDSTPVKA